MPKEVRLTTDGDIKPTPGDGDMLPRKYSRSKPLVQVAVGEDIQNNYDEAVLKHIEYMLTALREHRDADRFDERELALIRLYQLVENGDDYRYDRAHRCSCRWYW